MAASPTSSSDASLARGVRWVLFIVLAGSAVTAIGAEPLLVKRVATGAWPPTVLFAPIAVYAVFLLLYAVDRWLLVKKRRYPPGRAFFQVVFGVVFGLLLLPSTLHEWQEARPGPEAPVLDRHPEPRVRVLWIEAMGFRGPEPRRVRKVARAWTEDPDPRVRDAAERVLSAWSGHPADAAAIRRWVDGFLRSDGRGGEDR